MNLPLRFIALLAALVPFSTMPAKGMPAIPPMTPLDRLLKSANAKLAKAPRDPEAIYMVARIHYLAFATNQDRLLASMDPDPKDPKNEKISSLYTGTPGLAREEKGAFAEKQRIEHAVKALEGFDRLLQLAPKNALYAMGQASLLDAVYRWSKETPENLQEWKLRDLPGQFHEVTVHRVRGEYAKVLTLAAIKPEWENNLAWSIAAEAAAVLDRLQQDDPESLTNEEKQDLARAEKIARTHREELEKIQKQQALERARQGFVVTPIVFSFQPAAHLDELLDPARTVEFDLRGYGPAERWPWVKPELGFLVWDPLENGKIESARQLFGSFAFQLFWPTGYDAMAALDDNEDGRLTGKELLGMSVWFDRNGDGVSEKSEVTPLRDLPIESIAVKATNTDGIHPANPHGLTLRSGQTLPTWDWMVAPAGL